jgi:type II secretion system protein N
LKTPKKTLKYSVMILSGGLLTFFCLCAVFPADKVQQFLQAEIDRHASGLRLCVGKFSAAFPFGIEMRDTRLFIAHQAAPVMRVESLTVRPKLLPLLAGKYRLDLRGRLGGGNFQGEVALSRKNHWRPSIVKLAFQGISMGEDLNVEPRVGRRLEGTMNGTLAMRIRALDPRDWEGDLNLEMSRGHVGFFRSLHSKGGVDVRRLKACLFMKDRRIEVRQLQLDANESAIFLAGSVALDMPFERSLLNLQGEMVFPEAPISREPGLPAKASHSGVATNRNRYRYQIAGTIGDPKLTFLSPARGTASPVGTPVGNGLPKAIQEDAYSVEGNAFDAPLRSLTLMGTVSGDPENAFAVIARGDPRRQRLYRIGDRVCGGEVAQILDDTVIIRHRGKDRILKMRAKDGVRAMSVRIASGELFEDWNEIYRQISKVEILPRNLADGTPGLLFLEIEAGSFLERLGLKSGDILVELDGTQIRDPQRLALAAEKMKRFYGNGSFHWNSRETNIRPNNKGRNQFPFLPEIWPVIRKIESGQVFSIVIDRKGNTRRIEYRFG